jgi:hypothetical protein
MIHEISYFFATLAQIFAEDTIIFLLLIFIAYIINILVFKVWLCHNKWLILTRNSV